MDNLIAAVTIAILSLVPHWKSDKAHIRAEEYATIIVEESQAVQPPIDPFLIAAIIFKESSFRAKAEGKKGEVGLMQVMPRGTLTRSISKHSKTDVRANIRVGVGHLHYWQERCGADDMDLWLSAYNAGKCKRTKYAKRVRKVYCKIKPGGCGDIS
ncbi:MAG: lytic transglycosylase domain-containing protein [Deltaproteobacteria bacterium]|nr:lytic transglycosylase domain-containing protein [Deltaproteobacteria bacterium]